MILLFVSSCAVNSVGDFCDIYLPVPTLDEGTEEQRMLIDKNNAVYMGCE